MNKLLLELTTAPIAEIIWACLIVYMLGISLYYDFKDRGKK